ncbi:AEC family transporter [Bifidobacterium jacchi]|uniref:Permease n=1 Tax=Bifidobacterium jacchi TaxID=2490545 RepID=A0A5N5RM79_9BIFI|nr:AEC family transporter [Bifidobacterium jacchi]KAB5608059.1 permease [Bifidobacterium jacchi]
MNAILKPIAFLLIIFAAYLVKRAGLFRARDYRVMQVIVFDFTLPAAIIVSFATNPHHISMLLISAFAFVCALVPLPLTFLVTRRKPAADRAFLMLNASGFNVGNFCFPVLQAFMGPSALVTAAMFDIGNSIMVSAGTNVMTTSLLHIDMSRPITEQHAGNAPVLPYRRPTDRDARRMARRAKYRSIAKGFLTSVPFDVYMLMLIVMFTGVHIPAFIPTLLNPVADANSFCSVFMVGMLMDLPHSAKDARDVAVVLGWRLPLGVLFALVAWFALPFDAGVRKAVVMLSLAPTAVFSTLFTDRVLGNAKLAGFTLATSAIIAIALMTGVNMLIPA